MSTTSPITSNELTTNPFTTSPITSFSLSSAALTSASFTSASFTSAYVTSSHYTSSDSQNIVSEISSSSTMPIIAGTIGGVVFLAVLASVTFIIAKRKKKAQSDKPSAELELKDIYRPLSSTFSKEVVNFHTDAKESIKSSKMDGRQLLIDYKQIQLIARVGGGFFGDVYQATWRSAVVAVKQMKGIINETALTEFEAEAELMKNLQPHPNVVFFFGMCKDPLCIVTEFVEKGALSSLISNEKLDERTLLQIIQGISSGMFHLSCENIVHKVSSIAY